MNAVTVEGVGISASCPGTVAPNTNTSFEGTVNYRLVNSGADDALVDVLVELLDSAGHQRELRETFVRVSAGESSDFEQTVSLSASYQQPDRIAVTVRLSVTGAVTFSDFTECGFVVEAP